MGEAKRNPRGDVQKVRSISETPSLLTRKVRHHGDGDAVATTFLNYKEASPSRLSTVEKSVSKKTLNIAIKKYCCNFFCSHVYSLMSSNQTE